MKDLYRLSVFALVAVILCMLATGCATQRYDTGITVNCAPGGGAAGIDQAAKPAKQECQATSNHAARNAVQEIPAAGAGAFPQVLIIQNVSGNEGSTARSTPIDVLRGLLQGAEIPVAAGATPTSSLTSTGKVQTNTNSAPAASVPPEATKPGTTSAVLPAPPAAATGGDAKATPGTNVPGA